jgi:2-oxoglutarate ferredoxin oxidoreductase subunit beta
MADMMQYLRIDKMPHIWCPGCGHGIVMNAIIRAIDKLNLDQDKTVIVSGIGCSSRATGYMNFDTLHATHGRAIPFATGVKLAKPELHVIVITGDGDVAAIGGNHLIHAARRNIDLTVVCFNNAIYGMTSGQYSPMTPTGQFTSTAPYGNIDPPFELCRLVQAAGGSYIARGTAFHVRQLVDLIAKGITNEGFSFIEALSPCPTYYGRRNKLGTGVQMLKWYRDHAVTVVAAEDLGPEDMENKFVIGELYHSPAPEYTTVYQRVIARAQQKE